jgi:hypothetical protein
MRVCYGVNWMNYFYVWKQRELIPVILPTNPAYEDGAECSESSAYKIQTPGNHPKFRHSTFRARRKFEIKKRGTLLTVVKAVDLAPLSKYLKPTSISKCSKM